MKTKRISSALKTTDGGGAVKASALAYGVNAASVALPQNAWRETYNPVRGLNMERAMAIYDASRRGFNAELQNVYREMEGTYPTLMALIERRTAPLLEMRWGASPFAEDRLPKGASAALAREQAECLGQSYEKIENLGEAIEWLELGAFRGYAHLEKIYAAPGTADLTITRLEPVEQWHWTRRSLYAEWEYVANAAQTDRGVPIDYSQFVIHEAARPLDRVALILWMRASLCERDWDSFIDIYGVPRWLVFMPPNVPKEREMDYLAASRAIASGGNGALPYGSNAVAADKPRDSNPFRPRLDWLQEQLVLAGTGGLLSMLAMPTGLGHGATSAHEDAFKKISVMEARKISEVLQRQFDAPLLQREFPGQPIAAAFELAPQDETDIAALCAQALQLAQAGYRIDTAELSKRTGFTLSPATPEKLIV